MIVVLGLIGLFFSVFGLYMLQGGNISVIIHAAPIELATILGAGVAATAIGNSPKTLRALLVGIRKVFAGSGINRESYLEVIFAVAGIMKTLRTKGARALEADVNDPYSSELFTTYPRVLRDKQLLRLITDTINVLVNSPGGMSAKDLDLILETAINAVHREKKLPIMALDKLAGGLPALGIVACILGIVKTMAQIDAAPSVLGALIAAALVGTFLGVFLAYGIVEPFSVRLKHIVRQEMEQYRIVQQVIVGSASGMSLVFVIECARVSIEPSLQPSFDEIFDGLMR